MMGAFPGRSGPLSAAAQLKGISINAQRDATLARRRTAL